MEKIPIVLFPTLVNNIPRHRCYFWSKESSSLLNRCTDCPTTKEIRKYYWDRDLGIDSIKAKNYAENKFIKTRKILQTLFAISSIYKKVFTGY
jgi:Trm5-related predicted tRNA methylase